MPEGRILSFSLDAEFILCNTFLLETFNYTNNTEKPAPSSRFAPTTVFVIFLSIKRNIPLNGCWFKRTWSQNDSFVISHVNFFLMCENNKTKLINSKFAIKSKYYI